MGIIRASSKIKHRFHCGEIELAVAKYFNPRQNLIVPNISWGMCSHECDLMVLTQSNYAYEIEIKISAGDLKADAHKTHKHESKLIKLLYFAIPEYLLPYAEHIPKRAGIIKVWREYFGTPEDPTWRDYCSVVKAPKVNKEAEKWEDRRRMELMRLSTMRIWSLKETCQRLAKEKKSWSK